MTRGDGWRQGGCERERENRGERHKAREGVRDMQGVGAMERERGSDGEMGIG